MRYLKSFFVVLCIWCFCGCNDDEDVFAVHPSEQTVIIFMPWSTDMVTYFERNIADFETAVANGLLENERVIICMSSTPYRANIIELKLSKGKCICDTVGGYDMPDFTQCNNITQMLLDIRSLAPARRYSLIIGSHGMGWLPVSISQQQKQNEQATASMTRWIGGKSKEYQIEITTLADGISNAGMKMDYILFDDCYMSSVEVAFELKEVTDYLIGCPTEIMMYGFPYHLCAPYLVGQPNYQALCQTFYDFYTNYEKPCGTIAVTDCRELDHLAAIMRQINLNCHMDKSMLSNIQQMDGYNPPLFYDLGDYVGHLCTDQQMLNNFFSQLSITVPYKAHTDYYYSDRNGFNKINVFTGITTSASSLNMKAAGYENTGWYKATH